MISFSPGRPTPCTRSCAHMVRALAARDPRTAPATVARLTRDPDRAVREALTRHPNLPRPRLTELLDDEELAHVAAANPALEPEVLHRLVTMQGRRE
ncbi:hypothetical protein ABZ802_32730 [Streptomyces sp. NPDC047737]|uniref:hypothetical protein n=1 Tax=unclassified Streptomyces TaxID=2593676 RepID=UPI0033C02EE5